MGSRDSHSVSRRDFVRRTGMAAGGLFLGAGASGEAADAPAQQIDTGGEWPTRVLGRTGASVTTMTLGTAPAGFAKDFPPSEIAKLVNEAIDLGITSIDTAPAYEKAEEGVGLALGSRRPNVFLATKVMADTVEEAEKSFSNSLRLLKTDYVDLVYFHSLGNRRREGARGPEGAFHWLIRQKEAGKCRFVGVSGHHLPGCFPEFLASGEVDVLLTVVNFVDRHTYRFEEVVLPVAVQHNLGIVAMKVFGGANQKQGGYANPNVPPQLDPVHLQRAIRYALSTPGVTTLNIGVHNVRQLRQNVAWVKACEPMPPEEYAATLALGEPIAKQWGAHFGPVEETQS